MLNYKKLSCQGTRDYFSSWAKQVAQAAAVRGGGGDVEEPAGGRPRWEAPVGAPRGLTCGSRARGLSLLGCSLAPGACEASAAGEGMSPAQARLREKGQSSHADRDVTRPRDSQGCCPSPAPMAVWDLLGAVTGSRSQKNGSAGVPRACWVPPQAQGPRRPRGQSERLPEALPEWPAVAKWPAQRCAGAFKGLAHAVCLRVPNDAASS